MVLNEGWVYVFVFAIGVVIVAMLGCGFWFIDYGIGLADDLDGYVGLVISAGGGVAAALSLLGHFYRPPIPELS